MNRIPFQKSDIKEFKGIAKRLFRGLDFVDQKNPDRMREMVAKVFGYNDLHEVNECVGNKVSPPAGPITRFDIQLVAADGLMKLTNISFVEAWLRAGRARLFELSIDQFTVEALRDERLKARGIVVNPTLAPDIRVPSHNWHDEQARFFRNGAPSFELCVRRQGVAFHWGTFTSVYDAIMSSRFKEQIINPDGLFTAGSDDAVDTYLRESLIPQCWIPLPQLIQDGLAIPTHEAVWLYVESGVCIGRAIRHRAHGGYLPRLFMTDREVAEGHALILQGGIVQGGSSRADSFFGIPKGDELVYRLKPGVRIPGAVTDPSAQPDSKPHDLEVVPNLFAGSIVISHGGGRGRTTAWGLDGKAIRQNDLNRQRVTNFYFEAEPWLSESDMPALFPDHIPPPPVNHRDTFAFSKDIPNKVFLPPVTLEFQARAERIIERQRQEALAQLKAAVDSGVFLTLLKEATSPVLLEQIAGDLIYELYAGADMSELINRVSSETLTWFPDLAGFNPAVLCAAVAVHAQGTLAEQYPATMRYMDVLSAIVLLHAGSREGGNFRFFSSVPSEIAVMQWYTGLVEFNGIHGVADQYERYLSALNVQQARINQISLSLDHERNRRAEAFDHQYAYVGDEMPRVKPRNLMQLVNDLGD